MKKVILSLVFLLITGTSLLNANNEKSEESNLKGIEFEYGVCDDVYDAVRDAVTALTGDFIFGISVAIAAEERCLEEEEELEIIEE